MLGVRVFRDVFPAAVFARLRAAADRASAAAGRGDTADAEPSWFDLRGRPRTAVDEVILRLRGLVRPGPRCVGAEWWLRVGRPDRVVGWHFDKDEALFRASGKVAHPIYSSIFYLSGVGGPTCLTDQRLTRDGTVGEASRCLLVRPAANQYAVFPGNVYHSVVPARGAGLRRTLLVNWWDHRLEAAREAPERVAAAVGAARDVPAGRARGSRRAAPERVPLGARRAGAEA